MKSNRKNRPQSPAPELNPILIQSYFDGELESDELEALSLEAIKSHPMLEALAELREVVRYDSQRALEDINEMALLNAIHRQIASEKQVISIPKATQAKSAFSARFGARVKQSARWAPAFVGAALLLLSIPGLMMLFAGGDSNKPQEQPTVVCVDADHNDQSAPFMASQTDSHPQNNEKVQAPTAIQVAAPSLQIKSRDDQQLTVQEMDFAIRHLIDRIESLEDANRNPYDSTDLGLTKPAFDLNL